MALNKVNVPVAVGHKSEMDLPADHRTSMNFLLAQPVYYRHMPRKERLDARCIGVIRPKPIQYPLFGRCRNNLRAFFVPYRLVMPNYDPLRTNVIASNANRSSLVQQVPYVDIGVMQQYFLTTSIANVGPLVSQVTVNNPATDPWDFKHGSNYYVYTPAGRRRYKLLKALGYKVFWSDNKSFKYDCLALLCYARLYLDWYANSQYLDSAAVLRLEQIMKYNDPISPYAMTLSDLNVLLSLVFAVTYDSDSYFNHAWDNPVAPSNGQFTVPVVNDITDASNTYVGTATNGTPVMMQTQQGQVLGSQYIHDMLQKLSNYQRRHALSGARQIDRMLVDWGFASDYATLNRSIYIGNNSIDVQISDVMCTAETASGSVGDYAGKGFGQGQGLYDFTSDEDGMLIIVSTIIPSGGFVQGYDRNNRHLSMFDFYDANLEVGVQVIEKGEVYISDSGDFDTNGLYTDAFGFTGRYGEYKRPISWDSSENSFRSLNHGIDAWTLFREFDDDSFGGDVTNVVHSLDFSRGTDWDSYNRIFTYTGNEFDVFECFYHFDVHTYSPFKPLFETYDFKEAHRQIKMDINGSTLN